MPYMEAIRLSVSTITGNLIGFDSSAALKRRVDVTISNSSSRQMTANLH